MSTALRPLGIGEVVASGFRLTAGRLGTLLPCALAVAAPLSVLDTIVRYATDREAFDFSTGGGQAADTGDDALAAGLLSYLIGVLVVLLVLAACFRAISGAYLDERPGVGESLRFAVERLPALLVAYFLVAVSLIAGFVALVVPGIYLGVALSMTFPALLFERIGPGAAYGRSLRLVNGNWWRTLAVLLLAVLLLGLVSGVLGAGLGFALGAIAPGDEALAAVFVTLLNIVLAVALYPVSAAILTVLYYDLRVRKEGFDLELLARGLGHEPPPPERRAPPGWLPPMPRA